jgi:hypothetical protein
MTENNLTYYCPICITDFTDEGIQPFECLHILCNDCNEEFSKSSLYYKCPLCKSDYKKDLTIDKYILLVKHNGLELKHIRNKTNKIYNELYKIATYQINEREKKILSSTVI